MFRLVAATVVLFEVFVTVGCSPSLARSPVIDGFARTVLKGALAMPGEPFNSTDLVLDDTPQRRVIGYRIEKSSAYLWYEHGGRGYHHHLVRFAATPPYTIEESYACRASDHHTIEELIADSEFLMSCLHSEEL